MSVLPTSIGSGDPASGSKMKSPALPEVWQKGQQIQKKRLRDGVDKNRHLAWYDRGPGSAGFMLPPLLGKKRHALTHLCAPCYTMRPFNKGSFQLGGLIGPGAGGYKIPDNVTHHGVHYARGRSFEHKCTLGEMTFPAGPGSHNLPDPNIYLYRAPRSIVIPNRPIRIQSFNGSLFLHGPMIGPKVMQRTATQAVTLKGSRKESKTILGMSPGVGKYILPNPKRQPAWTMIGKPRPPKAKATIGPKYSLDGVNNQNRAPAWTLGQKHLEFTGILRTPCDTVDYRNLDKLY